MMEYESSWHLQAIACKFAHPTSLEYGLHSQPPDPWSEQLKESAFAEAEGPVELAFGVGNRADSGILSEILGFLSLLEHVNQNKLCSMFFGIFLELFKAAKQLAGKGAAKVAHEYQHQGLLV